MQHAACPTLIRVLGFVCCTNVRSNIFYSWQRRIKSFRATNKRADGRQSNVWIHFFCGCCWWWLSYYGVCYFVRIINWMGFSAGWLVANDSWFIELTYCFSLANANFTHSNRPKGVHMKDRPFWRRPTNKRKKPQIFFIGISTRAVFLFDHFHLTARIKMRQPLEIECEKLYCCWFKKFSERCDDGKCVWVFRDSFSPSDDLSVVI